MYTTSFLVEKRQMSVIYKRQKPELQKLSYLRKDTDIANVFLFLFYFLSCLSLTVMLNCKIVFDYYLGETLIKKSQGYCRRVFSARESVNSCASILTVFHLSVDYRRCDP